MMKRSLAALVAPFLALYAADAAGQALDPAYRRSDERSQWRASVGANVSRGSYGEAAPTTVWSVPLAVRRVKGPLTVKLSLPYLRIKGPADILETPQGRATTLDAFVREGAALAAATTETRSGAGDLAASATYSFDLGRDWFVDASARVKLPTASRRRELGSGVVDVTTGLDLVKEAGDATFYAGARRTFAGVGATRGGRDAWGAGAGASAWVSRNVNIGADYDWRQSSFAGERASSEATAWIGYAVTRKIRVRLFATKGLNGASADFAAGMTLSWRFR